MIANYSHRRCVVCCCNATRVAMDEYGESLLLCERCPSPEEIRARAEAIRARWSEEELWCRYYRCAQQAVGLVRHVCYDQPVTVSVADNRASRGEGE